mmetsp:Transcript_29003/g.84672  ORF Transcript_29003/g.84672 Transcript_29003/m.84672 type:complete len:648 (-) Transcript_29003:30-1973(-)|eukprot:CAMPEP_0118978276 /NCGR_PEP_ID=MMETSP1173-20130426/23284_1 /TAXON_ID=1034831 /ORGANISM="Rhizochromulina marina cf, Strain CCMP1243" /LENGTH=647 /DNA_ID=CAMNT_0006928461 /DNA_START=67 /DNA_END=2010 /DNA_ORIENTATION=-
MGGYWPRGAVSWVVLAGLLPLLCSPFQPLGGLPVRGSRGPVGGLPRAAAPTAPVPGSAKSGLPQELAEALRRQNISSLLPVQKKSFASMSRGADVLLHSPTGTGKTLAYVLPLTARLLTPETQGKTRPLQRPSNIPRTPVASRRSSCRPAAANSTACFPLVIVVAPSRELCRQIAVEWKTVHKSVAAVYGGVPIERTIGKMTRRGSPGGVDVLVATMGRLTELLRDGLVSTLHTGVIVLDEADVLLDLKENPEVYWLLDGMEQDYQLALVSATINKPVQRFAKETMELSSKSYVTISADDYAVATADAASSSSGAHSALPEIRHAAIPVKASARADVAADVIAVKGPRKTVIFAASKIEVEQQAKILDQRLSGLAQVHILHGDLTQGARGRTLAALRESTEAVGRQVLVATDVASRGLDVSEVDLVLQFGLPRKSGREGTFDDELYTHRAGRAGRVGGDPARGADAVVLYDPSSGEGSLLAPMSEAAGILLSAERAPAPPQVMRAALHHATERVQSLKNDPVVDHFKTLLSSPDAPIMPPDALARALAALSGVQSLSTLRSHLTADPNERTIRIRYNATEAASLSPSEVVRVCKSLGSGKIPRVFPQPDGCVLFDLSIRKAEKLVEAALASPDKLPTGWLLDMPMEL